MKIGDLVKYVRPIPRMLGPAQDLIGTVVDFPPATHPKEFQKVRVIAGGEMQDWIMQFCEVVNESR